MYFKHITLKNVGSIPELKYEFPFTSDGNPNPIILVGTNGSGKSTVLSYLLNSLIAAQQVAFDDSEVEKGRVYKLRSPQFIRTGESYNYARVNFGSDFSCYEWQLDRPRENYIEHFDTPEIDISFNEIPLHESSIFNTNFFNNPVEVSKQFSKNCVLYFPANRFEQPVWVNEQNLNAKAEFIDQPRINRISNRSIIQQSPLIASKNWLLDVAFDRANYDLKKLYINLPFNLDNLKYTTIPPLQNLTIPFEVFTGYDGYSSRIWDLITKLIKLILRSDENIRFGIGSRQDRSISIIRNNNEMLIPNIFQLSTGQTSVLNIVLSILKDFDMSGAIIESLDNISGVVIIDEVDAHLHADLQCNLLPEVISIFPKVQFILTTHSPLFLLGMKEKFKDVGFDILSLPTGQKIDIEEFEEFQSAFDFYKESNTFRHKIESEVNKSQKPVIFVEGDYDIKYLRKAASLLGKESILEKIDLKDGDGFGNLNNIWNVCKDSKISMAFPRIIGLIYDCDVKKIDEDRNFNSNRHRAKKRGIPSISDNPISKGIENLIPVSRINNLRESHPQFFDVKPKTTIYKAGKPIEEPEICEINKNQKSNLCKWLCENGNTEDFAQFESVFKLIEEIAELNNHQISLGNENIGNNLPDPLST